LDKKWFRTGPLLAIKIGAKSAYFVFLAPILGLDTPCGAHPCDPEVAGLNSLPTSKKNYHQSRLSHFMCNSCANKVETMKVMDTFSPYFGHNGRNRRYNTMWTRSPLDGVQEVGGSNPLAPTGIDSRKRVHFLCASVPVKIGELDAEFVQGLFVVNS